MKLKRAIKQSAQALNSQQLRHLIHRYEKYLQHHKTLPSEQKQIIFYLLAYYYGALMLRLREQTSELGPNINSLNLDAYYRAGYWLHHLDSDFSPEAYNLPEISKDVLLNVVEDYPYICALLLANSYFSHRFNNKELKDLNAKNPKANFDVPEEDTIHMHYHRESINPKYSVSPTLI